MGSEAMNKTTDLQQRGPDAHGACILHGGHASQPHPQIEQLWGSEWESEIEGFLD